MFYLYQAHLNRTQIDEVNSGIADHAPQLRLFLIGNVNAFERIAEAFDYFGHVANIHTKDVDDAFEIGNIGPECRIERIEGRQMSSVSVGNVLITPDNKGYICCSFGWAEMTAEQVWEFQSRVGTRMGLVNS